MLRDRYRGCLLWGAVGDALGRPAEAKSASEVHSILGSDGLEDYVPWSGWRGGPKGTITDDTQLTVELARSIVARGGTVDPQDLSERLVHWLPTGRGVGRSTAAAVENLSAGQPWWRANRDIDTAGNGAAMRAAPVGLVWALADGDTLLIRDAVLSALPTHTHPIGVAAAVAQAVGVAFCIRSGRKADRRMDARQFTDEVATAIAALEPSHTRERKPEGRRVYLRDRINEIPELIKLPPTEAFAYTWNGAFALESLPAALYCFLRSPDDPREAIRTAVYAGRDADTVAAMAGTLGGAWCGAELLRAEYPNLWAELEYREELIALADGLLRCAQHWRGSGG